MAQRNPVGSKTILIVDDEPLLRFDLADFFETLGWRVFEAGDADEAIAVLADRNDIRVVVTDVQMPGSMDGLKLAHYVRDRFSPTQLYVVSGNVPIAADDLPARTSFLPKPFDDHKLLKHIEGVSTN